MPCRATEGAATEGEATEGVATEGAAVEGAAVEGAAVEGAAVGGAAARESDTHPYPSDRKRHEREAIRPTFSSQPTVTGLCFVLFDSRDFWCFIVRYRALCPSCLVLFCLIYTTTTSSIHQYSCHGEASWYGRQCWYVQQQQRQQQQQ